MWWVTMDVRSHCTSLMRVRDQYPVRGQASAIQRSVTCDRVHVKFAAIDCEHQQMVSDFLLSTAALQVGC